VFSEHIYFDYDISKFTTYKVGGTADIYLEIHDLETLAKLSLFVVENDLKVLVIGNGSNMLISDTGFKGIAIRLSKEFSYVNFKDDIMTAGGIALMPVAARLTEKKGLSGFEWAVGIPGSFGGAIKTNAGGHGSDTKSTLISADVFDLSSGELKKIDASQLELSYRESNLKDDQIVLAASHQLMKSKKDEIKGRIQEIVKWRRQNQPGGKNAGSVYVNPPESSAGYLIESCGLKGKRFKSAEVSLKHANFIQADEKGSASDVYELIKLVRKEVMQKTGIELRCEVKLIGFED
jgi:UDP-N-acetylmuramate dehydrogenase